ncbi:MAG: hypothetical protein Aureis2KO_14760 [Aureisphaera sp.]
MKILKITTAIFVILLTAYACRVTVPDNDTAAPTVTVSVMEDDGGHIIASSSANVPIEAFTCPAGTNQAGQTNCCYVTNIVGDSVEFRIVGTDRGGVKRIGARVFHNQISNVRVIGFPSITPIVTNVPVTNHKEIAVTFDDPRSSYTLAFDVNNAGNSLKLITSVTDFSDNVISIPPINSGESEIQIQDIQAFCN